MKYVAKQISSCLTEYKLDNFDTLLPEFTKFVVVSQFTDKRPKKMSEVTNDRRFRLKDSPECGFGEILYGVRQDETLLQIKSIIDSSD